MACGQCQASAGSVPGQCRAITAERGDAATGASRSAGPIATGCRIGALRQEIPVRPRQVVEKIAHSLIQLAEIQRNAQIEMRRERPGHAKHPIRYLPLRQRQQRDLRSVALLPDRRDRLQPAQGQQLATVPGAGMEPNPRARAQPICRKLRPRTLKNLSYPGLQRAIPAAFQPSTATDSRHRRHDVSMNEEHRDGLGLTKAQAVSGYACCLCLARCSYGLQWQGRSKGGPRGGPDFPRMIIYLHISILQGRMVRSRRLELPRELPHSDLNAARLPIPPRPHYRAGVRAI